MKNFNFTSESVCAGHPDKVCDQISDAILDAALAQDSESRVAVETLACFDRVILAGEITTTAQLDYKKIAREQIERLGYVKAEYNFSHQSPIDVHIHTQSREIATGVESNGAGDQGMMFGFACEETKVLMPLPIMIAHALTRRIDSVREDGTLSYLKPDGKSQVTVNYKNGKPHDISTVVLAVPHLETVQLEQVKEDLYTHVILPILQEYGYTVSKKQVIINGTGIWNNGGPAVDVGLTGRKIIVDTYGGYARVGGGAFSGKDSTKVDRSGAYAARYIAKNIVAQNLAEKAEVRLAYIIGQHKPVMQEIETFDTKKVSTKIINDFMQNLINTSVKGINQQLALRRPIYLPTASYGHFGRNEFPWEQIK